MSPLAAGIDTRKSADRLILVAQRHAVEREAQLALVETAHRNDLRPFIGTKGIGRLEVDAWQLFERLECGGTGHERRDVGLADFLNLTRDDRYTSSK
jgi:hypothetical protein